MAIWTIRNLYKKEAVERQFWIKDGLVITKDEGFRWGTWQCESDTQPDIDLDNPDGFQPSDSDLDWEMVDMDDGSWVTWNFPEDMEEEEQERIQNLWDEDFFEGMENDGWELDETEYWIFGPLKLTNTDTKEEWHGEDK